MKVASPDRLGRALTEVLELLDWLRQNQVEVIGLRESIDQDSAMGRADVALAHRLRGDGAGRGYTANAPARWTLVGPHRHDNLVAFQQHPPDLHLGPRRDSADCLRGRITGPPNQRCSWPMLRCLGNNGQRLRVMRDKDVNTMPADTSSCPVGGVKGAEKGLLKMSP